MKYDLNKFTTATALLTDYVHSLVHRILEKKENSNEPLHYYYTLLFKTNNSLDTANLLIHNLINKPHVIDSAFLILRTILSDLIMYHYLTVYSKDDEEQMKINILKYYADHRENSIKSLKDVYQQAYNLSPIEVEKMIKSLNKSGNNNGNSSNLLDKKGPTTSVKTAIKYLISNRKKGELNSFPVEAFSFYDRFSKYEHFGELTHFLVHRQFMDSEKEIIYKEFYDSVIVITNYMYSLLVNWYEVESDEAKKFRQLRENIIDNIK